MRKLPHVVATVTILFVAGAAWAQVQVDPPLDGPPPGTTAETEPSAPDLTIRPDGGRVAPPYAATTPPSVPPPAPCTRTVTEDYAWQTALVDAGGVALLLGGAASKSTTLAALGTVAIVDGVPAVHFAHGEPGKGIVSATLRLLPVALVGSALSGDEEDGGGGRAAMLYTGLASYGALVFVDMIIAKHTRHLPITPSVATTGDGLTLVVAGTF